MAHRTLDFARLLGLNPEVHQATGMVSVQIDDTLEAAAMRLMAAADQHGRTLDDLASAVVTRRERFDP
jgi:hypothetical protein